MNLMIIYENISQRAHLHCFFRYLSIWVSEVYVEIQFAWAYRHFLSSSDNLWSFKCKTSFRFRLFSSTVVIRSSLNFVGREIWLPQLGTWSLPSNMHDGPLLFRINIISKSSTSTNPHFTVMTTRTITHLEIRNMIHDGDRSFSTYVLWEFVRWKMKKYWENGRNKITDFLHISLCKAFYGKF